MNLRSWLPFGRVPEIEAAELHIRLQCDNAPQVIDVRTFLEWRSSRISGAHCAPIMHLKTSVASQKLDRSRPVVVICLSAHRSIPAVRYLRSQGYDAYQLRQGMRAWWKAGLPVASGTENIKQPPKK